MRISIKPRKCSNPWKLSAFSKAFVSTKNTAAAAYLAQVKSEKLLADMKGDDSVFDYLLAEQEVDRLYVSIGKLTLTMTEFAPVAQKAPSSTLLRSTASKNDLCRLEADSDAY